MTICSESQPVVAVLEPGYADYRIENEILAPHRVRIVPVSADTDSVAALTELNPSAILVRERRVGQAEISACPNLKIIQRYGVGFDNIDAEAAANREIYVGNVPTYGAENEVSDHALALYLALQRRIVSRDAEVRAGQWGIGQGQRIMGRGNSTLGLIGYGKIGAEARRKFAAFGFSRVLVSDPNLPIETFEQDSIELADPDTICAEADVISLHAPLTESTHHIIDARRLALMKPTSLLVNVSRGGLIDEIALAKALNSRTVMGAGLDVFEHEPLHPDHPLRRAPNTILTDHGAWYSERSLSVLQQTAAKQVSEALSGRTPPYWVNRWPT